MNTKRICLVGFDLQWITYKDNAKILMQVLSYTENTNIFKCKSIDAILSYLWNNHYK